MGKLMIIEKKTDTFFHREGATLPDYDMNRIR